MCSLTSARVTRALPPLALGLAAATALAIVALDQPVARYLATIEPLPQWQACLAALDRATGLTWWKWLPTAVIVGAAALALIAPPLRRHARGLGLLALVHVATKLTLLELKPGLGRLRPSAWLARGGDDTFWYAGGIAFPSGHTGHYLSIALPLAVAWPRVGVPLLAVPVFASASRLATNAHFVGDVVGGAALVVTYTWLAAALLGYRRR
ncbi:MAG: phosphatase PAP2 family protein [Myxococcales bacterium]|nr:phosphatase PAP2 family protein [Myxococcales bacterium]